MKNFLIILTAATIVCVFEQCRREKFELPEKQPAGIAKTEVLSNGPSKQKEWKEPDVQANRAKKKFADDTLLVAWVGGNINARAMGSVHGRFIKHIQTPLMKRHGNVGFDIIKVSNADSAIEALKRDPAVAVNHRGNKLVTQRKYCYTQQTTTYPNDSLFVAGAMWGMAAINAPTAWRNGNKGDMNLIMADVDQGVLLDHPEICSRVWRNKREIPGNHIDDDGNGYVDDIYGWNWFDNSATIIPGFHAIHTAGTIAAKGNNGIGVIGVAPYATVMCLQFIGTDGYGYNDAAVAAWDYATYQKEVFHEPVVGTSNSWGYQGDDPFVQDAADRAAAANIIVVCAAGNSGENSDVNPMYPGAFSTPTNNVLTVAAEDQGGGLAYFSNYSATKCDIGAPGTNIWSLAFTSTYGPAYASHSGTSMACPHAAGAVIEYVAGHPGATYLQIKNALIASATPNPAFVGKCRANGVLNIASFAYQTPANQAELECPTISVDTTDPTQPQDFQNISNGFGKASFKWRKSTDVGSSVKGYWLVIGWPNQNNMWWTTDTSLTVDVYVDPTDCVVFAVDEWNNGSTVSNVAQAHPIQDNEDPVLPPPLQIFPVDSTSLSVVWNTATDNSGQISKYVVKWFVHGAPTGYKVQLGSGFNSYQILGLQPATLYDIRVIAYDPSNNVDSLVTSAMTGGVGGGGGEIPQVPNAPTSFKFINPTVSSLDASCAPVTGATGYYFFWKKLNSTGNYDSLLSTILSVTISNLDSSTTYTGYAKAINNIGSSAPSSSAQGTTLSPTPPPPDQPSVMLSGYATGTIHNLSWIITNFTGISQLQIKDKGKWIPADLQNYTSTTSWSKDQGNNKPVTYRVWLVGTTVYSNEKQVKGSKN